MRGDLEARRRADYRSKFHPYPGKSRYLAKIMTALKPSASLLAKLGSIAVHAEEFIEPRGHEFDRKALETLLKDPEIREWLNDMTLLAMVPVRRTRRVPL